MDDISLTEQLSVPLSGFSVSILGILLNLAAYLSTLATAGSNFSIKSSEATDETLLLASIGFTMFSHSSGKDISDD